MLADTDIQFDVFISYNTKDRSFVNDILEPKLESWDLRVCVDYKTFLPGQRLAGTIHRSISASRQVIFVCTKNFLNSEWCHNELEIVRSQDPAGFKAKAIPLVLEKEAVPDLLKDTIWCNLIDDINNPEEWNKLQNAFEMYRGSQPLLGIKEEIHSVSLDRPLAKNKFRILVVDNNQAVRNICSNILYKEGYEVDVSSNLKEVLTRAKSKTYHVALIEVLLADDIKNTDGLVVMDYLNKLAEGTKIICLSAQQSIAIARDVFTKYNAFYYIDKSSIKGSKDIIDPVSKACEECSINYYNNRSSLNALLADNELVPFWENEMMTLLKPKNGFEGLSRCFHILLKDFLPIRKLQDTDIFCVADGTLRAVYGKCWSKSIGKGICFIVYNENVNIQELRKHYEILNKDKQIIHRKKINNLFGIVLELDYISHIEFFSRI